jgi:hypothetical protein
MRPKMTKDPYIPGIAELAYFDVTELMVIKRAAASRPTRERPREDAKPDRDLAEDTKL